MRFKLGLPYISSEDELTVSQVLGCCGYGMQHNSHAGPCAMGVDIRRHKNVVIGCKTGRGSWRVLRVERLESMRDIMEMAYRFNVKLAVVDIRPYEDEVRQFQKEAKFRTYLCEYKENSPVGTMWNDNTGLVTVNRTEIMDASHRMLRSCSIELPGDCPEVRQFAIECTNAAKVEEINRRSNTPVFRYRKMRVGKPDDYRHALNYFIMAATNSGLGVAGNSGGNAGRPSHANNDYRRC